RTAKRRNGSRTSREPSVSRRRGAPRRSRASDAVPAGLLRGVRGQELDSLDALFPRARLRLAKQPGGAFERGLSRDEAALEELLLAFALAVASAAERLAGELGRLDPVGLDAGDRRGQTRDLRGLALRLELRRGFGGRTRRRGRCHGAGPRGPLQGHNRLRS